MKLGNKEAIERLYYVYSNSDKYCDFKETKESSDAVDSKLIGMMGKAVYVKELESLVSKSQVNHEKQGFIYGFQYALYILLGEGENLNE